MITGKAFRILNKLNNRLIEDHTIMDGKIITSNRGVPYLWLSQNKMNISVCYFGITRCLKIWTGCGTPENKYHKTVKTWVEVQKVIVDLLK